MPTMTTNNAPKAWLPDTTGELIVQPLTHESVAIQAIGSPPILAPARTNGYRVPMVTDDPAVAWVAEGEEIGESELGQDEEYDVFHKIGGLTTITREMADDSNPDIANQVGLGLARSIAQGLDAAFFGARGASNVKPPRGLQDIAGVSAIVTDKAWSDLDLFNQVILEAEGRGCTFASFVANPTTALVLMKLRKSAGSNEPLLQPDPTKPATRLIAGVPLLVSPYVETNVVWGVPTGGRVQIVVREDVMVESDKSVHFTSDKIVVKATARLTTLYPHHRAIQRIEAIA